MKLSNRAGLTRWCAAILLALLALSMLHTAAPHHAAQRDCATCKALTSPGVAQVPGTIGRPAEVPTRIATLPPDSPLCASARYYSPLRAPPRSPVL
jgi:hypothetical protein